MNYWVTPSGQVFEGDWIGFHTDFCVSYLTKNEKLDDRYHEWRDRNPLKYIHEFFEQELKWVRYCGWGHNPQWITESDNYIELSDGGIQITQRRLTKKQKEKMFDLTGFVIE